MMCESLSWPTSIHILTVFIIFSRDMREVFYVLNTIEKKKRK